ncbi:MAG: hypothetical protein KKA42_12405 [candidate division Zixibacteria bacterium]|nr:hypothetical protein [candidate division Zixibacteria bacterium]
MKILRVAIATVLTILMLYVAQTNSKGQPEFVTHTTNNIVFSMTSVPKALEDSTATISLTAEGPGVGASAMRFRSSEDRTAALPMYTATDMRVTAAEGDAATFAVDVTAGKRGVKLWYYFELVDLSGATLATFVQPDSNPEPEPFLFKYIGTVPLVVLILHIVFIFATVFCISMATVHAFRVVVAKADPRPMMVFLFWGMVTCFIGMIPFGIPMNYYAFDCFWEGVPFGTDATDNKTQLLFVYLLFATLAGFRTYTQGKIGRDLFAPRTLGLIGLASFAVMLFIYLIPHSIQFSAGFTYAFCYAWIGVVALLYVIGLVKSRA